MYELASPNLPRKDILYIFFIALFGTLFGVLILVRIDQWQRDSLYIATEAALPDHEVNEKSEEQFSGNDIANWKVYKNQEFGFQFKYPATLKVGETIKKSASEEPFLFKGKLTTINLYSNKGTFMSIAMATEDFMHLAGEGCCFWLAGPPLSMQNPWPQMEKQGLAKSTVIGLEKITIGNRKAWHFIRLNGYVSIWAQDTVAVPGNSLTYANMLISGPVLIEQTELDPQGNFDWEKTVQATRVYVMQKKYQDDPQVKKMQELFEDILKTFSFND